MDQKKKLDGAAEQLLRIFEQHSKDLPVTERDAKWRNFNTVVAKIGTRAKPPAHPKTSRTLRATRRQA